MNIFKTKIAEDVWKSKYKYLDETPYETQKRVARALSSVEKVEERDYWYKVFLNALVKHDENGEPIGLKAVPGGRITANIGTDYKKASLLNCYISGPVKNATIKYERKTEDKDFIIPVEYKSPNTGDNMINICLTLMEQALTLGSEGGWGMNFSFIRPRGSMVKGVGVEHPGVIKFMEVFDKMAEVIVAGNNDGYVAPLKSFFTDEQKERFEKIYIGPKKAMSRKGAMMAILDISHPDIEEYILAKQKSKTLTKFNMSVLITDEFIEAVKNEGMFDLKFEGTIYKTIKARELYDLIMLSTFNRNEPGVLFYDNMQKNNPLAYIGEANATNPCGEICGNPLTTTVCLLGSLNLTQYVNKDRSFNWDMYEEDVEVFARMLDNVCEIHNEDLPAYLWSTKNARQYGMGVNGFGSTLLMMGIPYNSTEGVDFAKKINRTKLNICLQTSALLAKEKGKVSLFDEKKYFNTYYWKEFLKGKLDQETIELVKKYGLRNMKQTTNPPLGNGSVLCDNVSNGVEPIFMFKYERTYITEWPEGLTQENIKSALKEVKVTDVTCWKGVWNNQLYYYEPHNRGLCAIETIYDYGYKWLEENYPEDIVLGTPYLVTTENLKVEDHIAMQSAFQEYLDQSISKTSNLPNDFPFDKFKDLYLEAHDKGLIGFTTYRDGTMESVLSKIQDKEEEQDVHIVTKYVKLPSTLDNGPTKIIKREGIKFYIHFSYLVEDKNHSYPVAIWITTNHQYTGEAIYVNRSIKALVDLLEKFEIPNEEVTKQLEKASKDQPNSKLAKFISMCLRHNLPIPAIINSLENIEGDNISSLLTAVRKFLASHIKDGTKVKNKKCSVCGSTNLVYQSGCSLCRDCGTSGCG